MSNDVQPMTLAAFAKAVDRPISNVKRALENMASKEPEFRLADWKCTALDDVKHPYESYNLPWNEVQLISGYFGYKYAKQIRALAIDVAGSPENTEQLKVTNAGLLSTLTDLQEQLLRKGSKEIALLDTLNKLQSRNAILEEVARKHPETLQFETDTTPQRTEQTNLDEFMSEQLIEVANSAATEAATSVNKAMEAMFPGSGLIALEPPKPPKPPEIPLETLEHTNMNTPKPKRRTWESDQAAISDANIKAMDVSRDRWGNLIPEYVD